MSKKENASEVYNELIASFANLKAEVLINEILNNSELDFSDIDTFNKSTFTRSFRRDVVGVRLDNHKGSKKKLQLDLARNGIYDLLPEGLFHEDIKTKTDLSYAKIRQQHKKEEKDARSFFAPLENEFFLQKVAIEQNERELIDHFTNLKNSFLLKFWGLDKKIPRSYAFSLLQFLPFAHKISGDVELMSLALGKILQEKVTIKKTTVCYEDVPVPTENQNRLGVDMTLQWKHSNVEYPAYEFIIGPIYKKNTDKFLENGLANKIIIIFSNYFVPLEIDIRIKIDYHKNESLFILDKTSSPRMGLTTTI